MGPLSFQAIRRQHGISIHQIADLAGVAPREEYLFEIGARVDQGRAETLVRALNMLTRAHYILADFRGPVSEQPTTPLPFISVGRLSWPKRFRAR